MEGCCPEEKKTERSESVNIVFEMIRDVMRKIRDVDGVEKQQKMALQLFKFLGSATDLTQIATKLMTLAMSADKTAAAEDASEEGSDSLEDIYVD